MDDGKYKCQAYGSTLSHHMEETRSSRRAPLLTSATTNSYFQKEFSEVQRGEHLFISLETFSFNNNCIQVYWFNDGFPPSIKGYFP